MLLLMSAYTYLVKWKTQSSNKINQQNSLAKKVQMQFYVYIIHEVLVEVQNHVYIGISIDQEINKTREKICGTERTSKSYSVKFE